MHALLLDLYANRCLHITSPSSLRLIFFGKSAECSSTGPPVTINIVVAACDYPLIVLVAVVIVFIICHQPAVSSSYKIFL
jgi:hypothetical protein